MINNVSNGSPGSPEEGLPEASIGWLEGMLSKLPCVASILSKLENTDLVFQRSVELAREVFGFKRIGIWLVEDGGNVVRGTYGVDEFGEMIDERDYRLHDKSGYFTKMAKACEGSPHYYIDEHCDLRSQDAKRLGRGVHMIAPMFNEGEVIGLVCADNLLPTDVFNKKTGVLLCQFGQVVSQAYSTRVLKSELALARKSLLDTEESQNEFLGMIGHEVRTPLNAIMGYAQLLRMKEPDGETADIANTIEGCGGHLMGLVDSFALYSHLSRGSEGEYSNFGDPVAVIGETIRGFDHQFAGKGLILDFTKIGDEASVQFDSVGLRQIVSNLLHNALKFTEEGRVSVKVSSRSWESQSTEYYIEVKDTGVGIAEENFELIFSPFQQIKTDVETGAGIGMGLAIVKRIVASMGGTITCESQLGIGTNFKVSLVFKNAQPSDLLIDSLNSGKPNRLNFDSRILIVEDDQINLEVLSAMMECIGYKNTEFASNGEEARCKLRDCPYDLVLMDVRMSGLDGISLTRIVREGKSCPINREVPIVAVTAHTAEHDREQCLRAGMNDYLSKPVMLDSLKHALEIA